METRPFIVVMNYCESTANNLIKRCSVLQFYEDQTGFQIEVLNFYENILPTYICVLINANLINILYCANNIMCVSDNNKYLNGCS